MFVVLGAVALNLIAFTLVFFVAKSRENAGWADFAWSGAMVWTPLFFYSQVEQMGFVKWAVLLWVILWGSRLGSHLIHRMLSEPEDGRYSWLRVRWGESFWKKLYGFYLIQGVVISLLLYPVYFILNTQESFNAVYTFVILLVGVLSVIGEGVADSQLKNFKQDPKNKGGVCRQGLWAYSRHPNYFFEWMMWLALAALALQFQNGYITLISPIALALFLFKGTGIPITERRSLETKGDKYRQYQKEVSVFIPYKKSR